MGSPPKKRERAIALQYGGKEDLPKIVASGAGELAKRIREFAKQNNIPIKEDDTLSDMLSKLEVGANISPESYRLVAEIISFLYHSDKAWAKERPGVGEVIEKGNKNAKK